MNLYLHICLSVFPIHDGGSRGPDCMVVGFTPTTYAISFYHH